ncbi:hypothetical protein PMAYCL1PPCAC_08335, partial [Pristionchus mayeri]
SRPLDQSISSINSVIQSKTKMSCPSTGTSNLFDQSPRHSKDDIPSKSKPYACRTCFKQFDVKARLSIHLSAHPR